MCGVVGIDKSIVKANQLGSGGAQKLMKGLTAQYWDKVERDGIMLYDTMVKMQNVKSDVVAVSDHKCISPKNQPYPKQQAKF